MAQQHRQQEVAVGVAGEDREEDDVREGEQQGEKRRHQDAIGRIESRVYHSENRDHGHDAISGARDTRAAKQQKLHLRHPRSLTAPSARQPEADDI